MLNTCLLNPEMQEVFAETSFKNTSVKQSKESISTQQVVNLQTLLPGESEETASAGSQSDQINS